MALPKQVQQQLDEAARIQQELAAPTPQPDPAPQDPPPADPDSAPPEPPPAPEPVEPAKDAAYWEHRFKTLEGMSRAEKARMEQALQAQGEQLQRLAAQLEVVRQQPTPPAPPEQPLVTAKDEQTFGADLVDMARRAAKEVTRDLERKMALLETSIKNLMPKVQKVDRMEQEVVQSREERFWSDLATAVPDWEAVNADQRWLKWLAEYDPVAGMTRQASLEAAQQRLDAKRAIGLFKLFKATLTPPSSRNQSKQELARQVAPTRTSTVTVQPTAEKRYTGAEYAYWLDPRRVNDTDLATATAMKAEVDRAMAEGRIDW